MLRHKPAMSDFFAMGGYAAYIWPAYGVSAVVLAGLGLLIWRRGRDLKKRLADHEARSGDEADDGAA